MTTFETSQGFANIKGFRINVTARLDTVNREAMKELVESTVKAWLYAADLITRGERTTVIEASPETKMAARYKDIVLQLTEPRVTVWGDMPNGAGFTLHSHSYIQDVLDVYYARLDALAGFATPQEPPKPQTPVSSQGAVASDANLPPSDAKSTQPNETSANGDGVVKVNGKKAAAALANGTLFEVPIYQVRLRSQDDNKYFEFYTKYGSNLGQYPEMKVYTDNEVAKTNGLLGKLEALGLTPGKDKMGEWTVKGVVREKDGKKNLYPVSIREAA